MYTVCTTYSQHQYTSMPKGRNLLMIQLGVWWFFPCAFDAWCLRHFEWSSWFDDSLMTIDEHQWPEAGSFFHLLMKAACDCVTVHVFTCSPYHSSIAFDCVDLWRLMSTPLRWVWSPRELPKLSRAFWSLCFPISCTASAQGLLEVVQCNLMPRSFSDSHEIVKDLL